MSQAPRSGAFANLLLLLGSLLMVAVLFAASEGVLRLAGLGAPDASMTSRLKYQQIFLPILEPGERPDGTPIWRTADPRLPYQAILREKPANGLRVFTFGGSATAGLGYSPSATFSKFLERLLRSGYPEKRVEVVNLGIVALSSKQVKLIVADVAEHFDPDLLIVYSGNNEFLEVHAQKYAEAHATPLSLTLDLVGRTNLFRLLSRLARGRARAPSLADQDFSHDDLRLTQERIIEDIEMTTAEIDAVIDHYEANFEELVASAQSRNVPLVLMAVASNWQWRGREDLPDGWMSELVPGADTPTQEEYTQAIGVLSERLDRAAPRERWQLLHNRAVAALAAGDLAAARGDYRRSMNEDPHLRRALDRMNDRVRGVAERNRVPFLDTVAALAAPRDGIVGFEKLYDYVHFTPSGAIDVAIELYRFMLEQKLLPDRPAREKISDVFLRYVFLGHPSLDIDRWLGIGFDPERLASRDLWKYDRMQQELDERIEANPEDALALAHRGNVAYFRVDGAAEAARDWSRALEIDPELLHVRGNLERLRRERSF